jgi:hypothetical protein
MRRLVVSLAVCLAASLVAAPALQAEDPPFACTQIGCSSGVGIQTTKVSRKVDRLTLCVQKRCKRLQFKHERPGGGFIPVDCTEEITVLAVLTARDEGGRKLRRWKELVFLETRQPNGPACPPTCFWGALRFDGGDLAVAPTPGA